jgi:4-alpha-glucanotransferase
LTPVQTAKVLSRRRAGVLLPVSALAPPGHDALAAAFGFIDWLAEAGFSVWQVLPLVPTDAGGSPYWARSDRAGNALLLGQGNSQSGNEADFEAWCAAQHWLADYALFESLSASHAGAPWWQWPEALKNREPRALRLASLEHADVIGHIARTQWRFDVQWSAVRNHARARGIVIFGDLPLYVAPDSVATWAAREQFQLSAEGRPLRVAGVPPDYFSDDGQLWGNPLYDWERQREDGFRFWLRRLAQQVDRYDLLRIDHFRALAAYWSVPADAHTAREGQWCNAPGHDLLTAVRVQLPRLELVAEDLGVITPEVTELRKSFALPGMRVVQFGFDGDPANIYLPHQHEVDAVVYTGTHDNDTTEGWYAALSPAARDLVRRYLGRSDAEVVAALMRCVLASVGQLAMLPMQDILHLGNAARLNRPGTVTGNWAWRLPEGALTQPLARHHADLNQLHNRT